MSETELFSHAKDSFEHVVPPEAEAAGALCQVTNTLHEVADQLDAEQPVPPDALQTAYSEHFGDLLFEGDYSSDDAEEFVIAVDRLTHDHGVSIWPLLLSMPDKHLQDVSEHNPDVANDLLTSMWAEQSESFEQFADKIALSSLFLGHKYGPVHTWRKAGSVRTDLPEYMHEAVADRDFTLAAVKTVEVDVPGEAPHMQIARVRTAQKHILRNCMGLPSEIASIYDRSLDKRTLRRDAKGQLVPASAKAGGIDAYAWHRALQTAAETVSDLDAEAIRLLYDELGIVNYDRFSGEQLDTMHRLLQGDPDTVAYFKSHDTAMQFGDVDGDGNNAMVDDPKMFDERMPTIVSEIHNIVDLYKPLITIARKTGIKPSILAFSLHGSPGAFGARDEDQQFEVVSWPVETGVKPKAGVAYEQYDVGEASGLSDFLSFYMQPHSKTGERILLFLSCSLATGYKGLPPLPEVVVSKTAPTDKVVARAPRVPVSVVEHDNGLRFFDNRANTVVPSIDFRLSPKSVAGAAKVVKKQSTESLF